MKNVFKNKTTRIETVMVMVMEMEKIHAGTDKYKEV